LCASGSKLLRSGSHLLQVTFLLRTQEALLLAQAGSAQVGSLLHAEDLLAEVVLA